MSELVKLKEDLGRELILSKESQLNVFGTDLSSDEILKSPDISEITKDVVRASLFPKIKDVPKRESGERIRQLINLTITESGFRNEIEDIKFLIVTVTDDIFRDFKHLTVKDIELAFKKGVRGTLGDGKMFGLSTRQFYLWLTVYDKELKREAYLELKKESKKEKIATPEEKAKNDQLWLSNVIRAYDVFKTTAELKYNDFNHKLYDLCWRQKIFRMSKEIKEHYFKIAQKEYLAENDLKKANSKNQRKEFAQVIKGIMDDDKDQRRIVMRRAKKLAINYIFIKFKRSPLDFAQTITDALKKDEEEIAMLIEEHKKDQQRKKEKEQQK